MTDTQCKQLLDDIDFNDPLKYYQSPNTLLMQKEEEKKQQKITSSNISTFYFK